MLRIRITLIRLRICVADRHHPDSVPNPALNKSDLHPHHHDVGGQICMPKNNININQLKADNSMYYLISLAFVEHRSTLHN